MQPPELAKALLAEAAEWRLLGLLFEYPNPAWREQVHALLPDLLSPGLRLLGEQALEYATEGLHIALFGPAGTVPIREVTHKDGVQFGYLMAELAAFYDAFGFSRPRDEADDHLAVELNFIAYLKMKEAFALAAGDHRSAKITADAAGEFVREHIALFADPLNTRLENFAPDYLIEAGRAIRQRTGASPKSAFPLSTLYTGDADCEDMSCGAAVAGNDLIQL